MKSTPLLFAGPMVRSLLNTKPGTYPCQPIDPSKPAKGVTRRVCKIPPGSLGPHPDYLDDPKKLWINPWDEHDGSIRSPYGYVGDEIWVRETWQVFDRVAEVRSWSYGVGYQADGPDGPAVWLESNEDAGPGVSPKYEVEQGTRYRPSIFMPKWACRIRLQVEELWIERLQDITEEESRAEGIHYDPNDPVEPPDYSICWQCGGLLVHLWAGVDGGGVTEVDCAKCDTRKKRFAQLWDSINGKKYPFESNPWVWRIGSSVKEVRS